MINNSHHSSVGWVEPVVHGQSRLSPPFENDIISYSRLDDIAGDQRISVFPISFIHRLDKKQFVQQVAAKAKEMGYNLDTFHVGDMMYAEAPDVAHGRILDLPIARLESLRRSVFKDILAAADAIVVPTPPSLYDFASTAQYFKMVKRVIQSITPDKKFDFIKVMPTKVERNKSRQMDFLDIMRDRFVLTMLRSIFSKGMEALLSGYDEKFAALDPSDYEESQRLTEEYGGLKNDLQQLYAEWEELAG